MSSTRPLPLKAVFIEHDLSSRNVELVLVPEPQHQQCAKNRNDDSGRMKLRARFGTRKDVRHQSPDNRTDEPEPDRPQQRHVHVHERFRSPTGDQTNDDVPNQMKHDDVSSFELKIGGYRGNTPETIRISKMWIRRCASRRSRSIALSGR